MQKNTYLALAALVLFLAFGVWYFVKDEPLPIKQPTAEVGTNPSANMTFAGSSIVEEKDGKRLWELSAEKIEVDPNTKTIYLHNLKALFYQPAGGTVEMIAHQGSLDSTTKNITMDGEIIATASDGSRLKAANLRYNAKENRIYGAGGVTVTKEDTVLTGDAIESDTNLAKVKISGNAKVTKGGKDR